MSQKFQKEVLSLAKKRGWTLVRKGGHEQTILEYHGGQRTTIWATPRSSPSLHQITVKLAALEIRSRNQQLDAALDYLCDLHGVGPDDAKLVEFMLKPMIRQFLGDAAPDRDVGTLASAVAKCDRVFLAGFSVRGSAGPHRTPRILLGKDAVLTADQIKLVEAFPQVNSVIIGGQTGKEARERITTFLRQRGWSPNKNTTWTHRERGMYGYRFDKAFAVSQKFPIVDAVTQTNGDVATLSKIAERIAKDHGVVPVQGEQPSPALPEKAWPGTPALVPNLDGPGDSGPDALELMRTGQAPRPDPLAGMPEELAAGLRAFLKIDNKNVLSGLDLVYESLGTAEAALAELRGALDLIKIEEG